MSKSTIPAVDTRTKPADSDKESTQLAKKTSSKLNTGLTNAEDTKDILQRMVENKIRHTVSAGNVIPVETPYDALYAERIPILEIFKRALIQARYEKLISKSDTPLFAAECGVYRGRCARALLQIADQLNIKFHLTGLDTFEGLPDLSKADKLHAPENIKYRHQKLFADTTIREVEAFLGEEYLKHVDLHKGLFVDSLKTLAPDRRYFFVNIDCDLYEGHLQCLQYFYKRLTPGGVIFLDDYFSKEYPMAKAAVDAFLKDKPEEVFCVRYASYPWSINKAYITKQR